MEKLNLGDGFTSEDGGSDVETKKEETTDDSNKDESEGDGINKEETAGDKTDETTTDGEKDSDPDKEKELQGLLDTETNLDKDIGSIDEKINATKERIRQKRLTRREGRELVEKVDGALPKEDEEDADTLSDIDPETIKVLERFTKAKGLVPKSELGKMTYQQAHKSSEDEFYKNHPEYLPDNDTDDVLYNALKTELSLFATPSDSRKIPELFEKAHKNVKEQHPDKFKSQQKQTITKETKKSSAIVKKQALGGGQSGGGTGNSVKKEGGKSFSDKQIQALRDGGWTDDEIKELNS